jgi:hypothetical protein
MDNFTKPLREVDRVFIHCSASNDESLRGEEMVNEIRRWHLARGFSNVGYHFLIDREGKILAGRTLEGHNTGTIAIMVHGLESFSFESLKACRMLCTSINEAYEGKISFHGHCEVSEKICPVFDYKALLDLDRFQRMP